MHGVAVRRDFMAQHFLIGGDWGDENFNHTHHYILELRLFGKTLDHHGYLVDIVDIEDNLAKQVNRYRDKTLNELPEFEGLNPSVEHFSRILCESLSEAIQAKNLTKVSVVLWENDEAWASYEVER